MSIAQFIADYGLDAFTTALGLLYILLEYRASIWLWLVGIVMPALDIYLYWGHGLYGDAGMAAYYTIAAIYGYVAWKMSELHTNNNKLESQEEKNTNCKGITHFPVRLILPTVCAFLVIWAVVYYILVNFTNSTVPATDAFTNAVSFIGLWALARKYVEQWLLWIVVDLVCCYLYIVKGIPFKAFLYGLYVVIAVLGYRKWMNMMAQERV